MQYHELISSRTNQNMRNIEFLEQTQEILLGFMKEREEEKRRIKIGQNYFTIHLLNK